MAVRVSEIMNREVLQVQVGDTATGALDSLLSMGVSGAPVSDANGKTVGVISLRDLIGTDAAETVGDCMTAPPLIVHADARITDAASLMAESGYRRLPVVDDDGSAIGMVSILDVLRALLGLPASHPAVFPHFDLGTGLNWSDDVPLALERVDAGPEGPGCLALVYGGAGMPEAIVWVESPSNVRARLTDIVSLPQDNPELHRLLEHREHLRFRVASITDPELRRTVQRRLQAEAHRMVRTNPTR